MLNRLIISLSIALLLVGCSDASDRDTFYSPGVANITVAELRGMLSTVRPTTIDEDFVLSGRVISSDEEGNIYATLHIDDGTGAVAVQVDMYDLHTLYPEGLRLSLHLRGCAVAFIRGVLTVGLPAPSYDYDGVEPIASPQYIARVLRRGDDVLRVEPLSLPISALRREHCGRSVAIEGLTLRAATSIEEYDDATLEDAIWEGSVLFEDAVGDTIAIYTSSYARFAEERVPRSVERVMGIIEWGRYGQGEECYQIVMSHVEDCVARM